MGNSSIQVCTVEEEKVTGSCLYCYRHKVWQKCCWSNIITFFPKRADHWQGLWKALYKDVSKKAAFSPVCRLSHLFYVLNSFILEKDIFYHLKQLSLFKLPKNIVNNYFCSSIISNFSVNIGTIDSFIIPLWSWLIPTNTVLDLAWVTGLSWL